MTSIVEISKPFSMMNFETSLTSLILGSYSNKKGALGIVIRLGTRILSDKTSKKPAAAQANSCKLSIMY